LGNEDNAKSSIFAPAAATAARGPLAQKTGDTPSWIDAERRHLHEASLQSLMGPEKKEKKNKNSAASDRAFWSEYICHMTFFISTALLAVMASCTALRTHLFIWTVFSPKYLYSMAWTVGWHLLVNVGLGSALNGVKAVA
jgi:ethanolaminephosphotransferase